MGVSGPAGFVARPFSTLEVGEEFWGATTLTESHLVLGAAAFDDPGPNHVNAPAAEAGRFGGRVAHGPLLVGLADGVIGDALGATIVALLEQSCRFRRPARPGDTVITRWEVSGLEPKEALGGGVASLQGALFNQRKETLAETDAAVAVAERAPWLPWEQIGASAPASEAGSG